jgi:hypothetical protein
MLRLDTKSRALEREAKAAEQQQQQQKKILCYTELL